MMIQHVHFVVHRFRLPPWRRLVGQSNVDTLELVQKLSTEPHLLTSLAYFNG